MSKTNGESNQYTQLRNKAEAQLKGKSTPSTNHWSLGIDALTLLHRLSSNPESAEDAVKLLHELQVHQVELDLQHEEIVTNEQALAEDLDLYRELYDCAPFGYFLVDSEGVVVQANPVAAEIFGIAQDGLKGQRIDRFLAPDNRPATLDLLRRVTRDGSKDSCKAVANDAANNSRELLLLASPARSSDCVLLACCEYPNAEHTR